MNLITKTTLLIATSIALLGTAQAAPMQTAKNHAEKAIEVLQEKATDDKGGHKVAAIRHLKAAIEEIEKGVAHDKANDTKGERKKKNQ